VTFNQHWLLTLGVGYFFAFSGSVVRFMVHRSHGQSPQPKTKAAR
jgi:hypothetical protein